MPWWELVRVCSGGSLEQRELGEVGAWSRGSLQWGILNGTNKEAELRLKMGLVGTLKSHSGGLQLSWRPAGNQGFTWAYRDISHSSISLYVKVTSILLLFPLTQQITKGSCDG